jgi:hypothetical protein
MGLRLVHVTKIILGFGPNMDLIKITIILTICKHCELICLIYSS